MVLTGIEKIIFVEILKISSSVLNNPQWAATMQDRLLYLIFIPHVLLVIFIWIFADNVSRIGGGTHVGIRTLVSIATYVFIVFAGWYGSLIVPIFVGLWQLILAVALISFVLSRFLHPARAKEMMALGKVVGEKVTEKGKIRKKLEHERDAVRRMMREIQKSPARTQEGMQYKEMQLAQLRAKLAEIEHELEEL